MFLSQVHSPVRRLLMFTCVCSAIVLAMASTVHAATLAPGASFPAVPGATVGGTVVADTGYVAYGFGNPLNTGMVRQIVLSGDTSNPFSGGLTFVYQVTLTSGDISRLSGSNYSGFKVDASVASAAAGDYSSGKTPGGFLATTLPQGAVTTTSRSISGAVVRFDMSPLFIIPPGGPYASELMIARTDAVNFTTGTIGLIDGGSSPDIDGFAPAAIPEPASMTLLGIGLLGMGGYAWRRRKGEPTAEAQTPAV